MVIDDRDMGVGANKKAIHHVTIPSSLRLLLHPDWREIEMENHSDTADGVHLDPHTHNWDGRKKKKSSISSLWLSSSSSANGGPCAQNSNSFGSPFKVKVPSFKKFPPSSRRRLGAILDVKRHWGIVSRGRAFPLATQQQPEYGVFLSLNR